ncbi:Fibrinogen-like protein A,Ryncolin-4,Angiopoietin-related protein 7,Ficolin-3,Ficolin-1-B,Ficolin-2,Ryncolin-1,Tenascin-R,Fibrinogen-like protein 1,Tenascin-X,Tenascin-N,Ryncolin-3,Tenascin,Fibroleukin,Fibrinogen C domain-containing protein 1,Ryncolin-2,Fibrinogen beta chain,Angiopoietin-related protein 2,Angiopoietin-2,Microfibril-associated glycoprotein 4,Fibrinogen alpha chain,Ficolin-1-A,Ficolin-1,Angiopoietin-4 [Mytilus coruscus]|uniref:Fibrinogen C-terminal domain-containing protein n=1 Tax=Mytilus coruscus TaxID=42192 RepID=A0A6J8A733_MYTCO|nr:Fibrinogen-like protein A,Ryncolin-4,Angiopoietin-related protein 7,Ficolin-3,Ficolin-1-B,Ficolin-2,Ryncolin-1,Tenascin-R,Fibrinogen-like protein 1,Tenascin-X,Tenascin-N,Ryncolin-3,Tenascin,Fibroleukin,Fibrinogen C domain-containing protein 1,Ryncolin-2,Fibrinogen beta chain,Angiopoietin-related protein 2,Angiopoietin-2,Microfibril-associated glycoprotein 4,Fibrinogen alpha chain,Ficolin-1-A,Ficolin-1,Angiopoietin-4 [Mytilus coruscus]
MGNAWFQTHVYHLLLKTHDVRTYRESKETTRVDDILQELQGICFRENEHIDVIQLKKDTQSILKNMAVYKDVVKMNKKLKDDIKWILEGICGRKETGKDCTELKKSTATSGVYQIFPDKTEGVKAYCDMDTDNGGWTIIQKRYDGSVNFQRSWTEYENGFGNVKGEYWLGNKHIHRLTSSGTYELRIDLTDKNNYKYNAKYETFVVGDASSQYKLTVGSYSGNAGDALKYHNGRKFSAVDRDNDSNSKSCVKDWGPWWHGNCSNSALNNAIRDKWYWYGVKGNYAKTTVMMIRKI